MKLADNVTHEVLLQNGFTKVDKDDDYLAWADYELYLDMSRRGQYYYIGIKEGDRNIYLEATEPDGSGGKIKLDNTIIDLIEKGIFVKS